MDWAGDSDFYDAANEAPVTDWRLASLLTSILSTNNLASLLSVNNPDTNAWQETLDGLIAWTNSTANPFFDSDLEFDSLLISSNSSQAAIMASAIQATRAAFPGDRFPDAGDVLWTPQLAEQSPYLNNADNAHFDYSISDEAYEKIPSQLLSLLRSDSIGSVVSGNGQAVVKFSGYDHHTYQTQVSSDLIHWTDLGTSQPVNGVYSFTVSLPAGSTPQFYRSVLVQ